MSVVHSAASDGGRAPRAPNHAGRTDRPQPMPATIGASTHAAVGECGVSAARPPKPAIEMANEAMRSSRLR